MTSRSPRRSLWFPLVLLAAAVAAAAWFFTRDRDEAQIRALVEELALHLSKSAGEAPGITLGKVAGLEKFFAPQVELVFPREKFHRTVEPREIVTKAAAWRNFFREVKFRVSDFAFLARTRDTATAEGVGLLRGRTGSRDEAVDDSRGVEMEFVKSGGRWRIRRIAVRDVLQK